MATEELHCVPCLRDGETVVASARCLDCAEELCNGCMIVHNKLKTTSKHFIKQLADAFSKEMKQELPLCDCAEHPDENVQYFCNDHKSAFCGKCILTTHRACKNVQDINSLGISLRTNSMLEKNVSNLEQLKLKGESIENSCVTNLSILEEERKVFASEIASIRLSVVGQLEEFEKVALQKFDRHKIKIETHIQEDLEKVKHTLEKANEQHNKMMVSEQWGTNSQYVIAANEQAEKFKNYENQISGIVTNTENLSWSLTNLKTQIESFFPDGNKTLIVNKTAAKDSLEETMNLKFKCDEYECFFVGVGVLDNDWIVVADYNNSVLKLLNIKSRQVYRFETDCVKKVLCYDNKTIYVSGGHKNGLAKYEVVGTEIIRNGSLCDTLKTYNLIKYKDSILMLTSVKQEVGDFLDSHEVEFKYMDKSMKLTNHTTKPLVKLSAWRGLVFDSHTSRFIAVNPTGMSLIWLNEIGQCIDEKCYDNIGRGGFSGLAIYTNGRLFAAATRRSLF